jgi:hypothetical protein
MKKDPTKAGAFFISVLIIEDRWKLLCHSNVLCYELFRRFRGLTEIWAGFLAVDGIRGARTSAQARAGWDEFTFQVSGLIDVCSEAFG